MSNSTHHRTPNPAIKALLKTMGISISQFSFDQGFDHARGSRIASGWEMPKDPARRKQIAAYLGQPEGILWPTGTEPTQRPITCPAPSLEG